jgi:serine/threonine protein kinase/Tol biopolymer transport system component
MSLAAGRRLGPYEVVAMIGAGGMGEVYKGKDTRLERTVAIKVLASHLATDPDLRPRFEREAKTISGLSHPNICTLFDVGHEDGIDYLVMEHLEGESLEQRLRRGPLPLGQSLRHAVEIADALDKAHRHGVVHRDLKPSNIILTKGGAKLLDFGLAKAALLPDGLSGASSLATPAKPLTEPGTVLGTFQYMAPEQLEGHEADARGDLFAFGAVLYEMVTGRRAFEGKSKASLISAIMSAEPTPLTTAAPMAPPALERVVRSCLAKDPDDRWQSAHDVAAELRWIAEAGSQAGTPAPLSARRRSRERLGWLTAAVAAVLAMWFAFVRSPPGTAALARTNVLLPERVRLNNVVLSPDGKRLAFSGIDPTGKLQIWVRSIDSYTATPLAGTDNGILPFWSPDGQSLGFFADRKLKRVSVAGGAPILIEDANGVCGAWAPAGDILFAEPTGPILRMSPSGGKPEPVTRLDASNGETSHRYPFFLPDGRHFLYLALNTAGNPRHPANRIWVGSLDGAQPKPIIPSRFGAQYGNGYLLFVRGADVGASLLAQRFDPVRLEVTGEPITVADAIGTYNAFLGFGTYSVSQKDSLVFDAFRLATRLEWFDRAGRQTGSFGDEGPHAEPAISPDGAHIAFDLFDSTTQTGQIYVGDTASGVQTRVTSGADSNFGPVWSPDGTRLAFQSDRKHQADVFVKGLSGGDEEALTDEEGQRFPTDWSRDGRYVVIFDREAGGARRMALSAIPFTGDRKRFAVVPVASVNLGNGRLSPDDRWLAYESDETGRLEVYVVAFPDGHGKTQISSAGGGGPFWVRGGHEILYTAPDGSVASVEVDTSHGWHASAPKTLFHLPEGTGDWDVTRDGERFLVNVPVTRSSAVPLSLIFNWTTGLRR